MPETQSTNTPWFQHYIFKKKVNPLGLKKAFFEHQQGQQAEGQIPTVLKAGRAKLLEFKKQKKLKRQLRLRYQ